MTLPHDTDVMDRRNRPQRTATLPTGAALAGLASVAAVALLSVGCSGGPKGAGVAGRDGTTIPVAASGSSGSRNGPPQYADALRYSRCMRSHGISDFPDPSASGIFAIHSAGPNSDLDRTNPTFQAAEQACQRYSPQHDVTPAQHAQLESEYLRFAKCMQSHGVSDFPDPVTGSGGHPGFYFQGGTNSDLNSNNPAFQRGVEACQHILGHKFESVVGPGGGKGA
jgi:hypothetical protein